MNAQNEKYLTDNFKFLPQDKPTNQGGTYFIVGDGWFEFIKELCEKIKALGGTENLKIERLWSKHASGGGLRVYFDGQTVEEDVYDDLCRLLDEYRRKSFFVCESCGNPGTLKSFGFPDKYHSVLCNKC